MDPRVRQIAKAALGRLSDAAPAAGPLAPELRISSLTMAQLSRLAYLQADDPLVAQVLDMLRQGRPVFLDRAAVEAQLGMEQFPPRVQEQFKRWFIRIAGYGVALTGAAPAPAPAPGPYRGFESAAPSPPPAPAPAAQPPAPAAPVRTLTVASPDRQVFSEILGEPSPEPHPCVKEPGKACCGSGRCKTLGF